MTARQKDPIMDQDTRLRVVAESLPFHTPFRISRGVKTATNVVRVEISAHGQRGWGEGVPYGRYGETSDSVVAQIEAARSTIETTPDRRIVGECLPPGAARNAVDCALWDLESRLAGCSVASFIGQPEPEQVETAITVGLDRPDAMAAAARAAGTARVIKVKLDATDPGSCLRAVRDAAPDAALLVDPNESWDADLIEALQPLLLDAGVVLVEQPVPAADSDSLRGRHWRVPNCADEACHTVDDLPALAGCYEVVNIKLDKTGGLTGALELLGAARRGGFGVMVGCMTCSSLSIAPAMHIATQADFIDLDGAFWLRKDRPNGLSWSGGTLRAAAPGFWGHPDPTAFIHA